MVMWWSQRDGTPPPRSAYGAASLARTHAARPSHPTQPLLLRPLRPHLPLPLQVSFLSSLNLSFNSLSGPIPALPPRLRYLNLRSNSLSGAIPAALTRSYAKLQVLYLDDNALMESIPTNLSSCSNLLSGMIPAELGMLPQFLQLHLNNNLLIGTIPPSLGNISTLNMLYLSSNYLHGRIPPDLGRLEELYVLDLVFNRLSSEIPPAIFNFSSLFGLGLGNNSFSGRLPTDFDTNLPGLEFAYLYNNQVEWPIPTSIVNNKFSGLVPGNIGTVSAAKVATWYNRFEASQPQDWSFIASLSNYTELLELDL